MIKKIENCEVLITDKPIEFILPPSTIHGVITLTHSYHCSGYFLCPSMLESDLHIFHFLNKWAKDTPESGLRDRYSWVKTEANFHAITICYIWPHY